MAPKKDMELAATNGNTDVDIDTEPSYVCRIFFEVPIYLTYAICLATMMVYMFMPTVAFVNGWRVLNNTWEDQPYEVYINRKNMKLSVSFLQLFEHIGEALPQIILTMVYYINNYDYIVSTDFNFEVFGFLITQTLISMILSAISILKGIVTGIISCCKLKAWKASENEQNETL